MNAISEQELEQNTEHKKSHTSAKHHEIVNLEIEKGHAAKGDESDGHVNWTWKQIIATISLCGVYVGKSLTLLSRTTYSGRHANSLRE